MAVPDEVESLITDATLSAHVATSVDDRPHVAPVWYLYDDGVVSFVTSGRKLRNLRQNPRVALSIEDQGNHTVVAATNALRSSPVTITAITAEGETPTATATLTATTTATPTASPSSPETGVGAPGFTLLSALLVLVAGIVILTLRR